jgi:hypothetical protein
VFSWAEIGFAQFDFELIALTLGTYQTGRLSSWHGFGTAQLAEEVRTKVARIYCCSPFQQSCSFSMVPCLIDSALPSAGVKVSCT